MTAYLREITSTLKRAVRAWPAVVLTGPRRAGKTFVLQRTFPQASCHLLEDPDVLARIQVDPRGWLDDIKTPAILDEIQNAPQLLPYIRTRIDRAPTQKGRWLVTGSQDFSLMKGVSESMAGRAAVLHLMPLSFRELGRWDLLRGGFPEVWLRPRSANLWFASYVQTYLERDVRAITAVRDLATFRRFLSVLATRNGQMLNKTEIAAPLGISVPTVTQWISVLETTGLIRLVPPFFENLGKRLVKSPKLYWMDPGLVCHLLGLADHGTLVRSPLVGTLFETFVASEILKNQANTGRLKELYYFRDHQGLEVDFVVPDRSAGIVFLEVKWSRTPVPEMAKAIKALLPRVKRRPARGVVVHRRAASADSRSVSLGQGVEATPVEVFLNSCCRPTSR